MLNCQKHLFDLEQNVTYLNGAYMSPLLNSVVQAGTEGLIKKQRPYQITGQDFFTDIEKLKKTFCSFIDADDYKRIAPIPAVSYGIANVALNIPFKKGDNIILLEDQFPSNVYAWMNISAQTGASINTIARPNNPTISWTDKIIEAINPKTKCVAMCMTHWADGYLYDLVAIRQACDEVGAYLIIDGTQSVGALEFSVKKIRPDALICAGYKWLLGPYSMGLAYYGERFDDGMPIEQNWISRKNSDNFADLVNYQDQYRDKAFRYSVGEMSNIIMIPMLQKSIQQLALWQTDKIQAYLGGISQTFIENVQNEGYKITSQRAHHLFGLELPKHKNLEQIKQKLTKENIFISFRGQSIRISPNVYNTKEDFDKLYDVLR